MRWKLFALSAWALLVLGCRSERVPTSVPAELQQMQEAEQKHADDEERTMRKASQVPKRP